MPFCRLQNKFLTNRAASSPPCQCRPAGRSCRHEITSCDPDGSIPERIRTPIIAFVEPCASFTPQRYGRGTRSRTLTFRFGAEYATVTPFPYHSCSTFPLLHPYDSTGTSHESSRISYDPRGASPFRIPINPAATLPLLHPHDSMGTSHESSRISYEPRGASSFTEQQSEPPAKPVVCTVPIRHQYRPR